MTIKEEPVHMENSPQDVLNADDEKAGIPTEIQLIPQPTKDPNDPLVCLP